MKFKLNKLIIPFILAFLIFTLGQVNFVSAQQAGGAQAAGLEDRVSGELRGRVGVGVFMRLRTTSGTSAKKKTAGRKQSSPAKTATTKRKPATAKSTKNSAQKNTPVEINDEIFEDYNAFEVLTYKPVNNLNTAERLAGEFSPNASEKQLILELLKVVKAAYDEEALKKGKTNDVALAMTFFISTCVTVYNEAREPDEKAFDNLYDVLAEALIEDEQFLMTDDRSKQKISETLVYISGLILAGYLDSKENNDQDNINVFRSLAGVSLLSLTQIDPGKMSFNENGLYIQP